MLLCKICGWEVIKLENGIVKPIERASAAAGNVPCGNCDAIEVRVKAAAPAPDSEPPRGRSK